MERAEHIGLHIKRLIPKILIVSRKKILIHSIVMMMAYILNANSISIGMMGKMMFSVKCMILREIF